MEVVYYVKYTCLNGSEGEMKFYDLQKIMTFLASISDVIESVRVIRYVYDDRVDATQTVIMNLDVVGGVSENKAYNE